MGRYLRTPPQGPAIGFNGNLRPIKGRFYNFIRHPSSTSPVSPSPEPARRRQPGHFGGKRSPHSGNGPRQAGFAGGRGQAGQRFPVFPTVRGAGRNSSSGRTGINTSSEATRTFRATVSTAGPLSITHVRYYEPEPQPWSGPAEEQSGRTGRARNPEIHRRWRSGAV